MKSRLALLLAVCISCSLVLSGCWNSRELNELAIVSGIGIDSLDGKPGYRVTFQIINPSSSSQTMGSTSNQPPIVIVSATDRTIFGALRKASRRATRQLFFAHTQLVIIGESLARAGVTSIFDIFERSHELRLNSAVLVAKDSDAASVLKLLTTLETLPSMGLLKKMQNTSQVWGENRRVTVFEVINGITGASDFTINGVQIVGDAAEGEKKSSLEQSDPMVGSLMSGLGVFKEGRLIGWLNGLESRGTQWMLDKLNETNINVDSPDTEEDIAVNIFYSKTGVKVELQDGKPVFHVHIREEGIINETGGFVDLSKEEELETLEQGIEQKTSAEVRMAFEAAQKMKTDIFNLGNELKRIHPEQWEKVKQDWSSAFAEGELDLRVEAFIRSTGMRLKPYIPAKK
ncbi:Ger(x)C family spore germination protein [Paenibacillus typhae]|uniref:Ger(x)C family spore germination protein n=1 Tax=Paenibacillus typhae TaxID=1174501 RepID=UPI001C8D28A9|nr:Ger(x)C family spore germination protein [Paenibacillus typhae]MBY0010288.1 Ger(x)C family spore germination protein [Paenibacillus typhae]